MEISRAVALWRILDPEDKGVLDREEFIIRWKASKNTSAFKLVNPSRPTILKTITHVSIFSFTHGHYFADFKTCWSLRYGQTPLPKKLISVSDLFALLAEISFPHNPRTFARLLLPRSRDKVSLALFSNIDHLAKPEVCERKYENTNNLELLGRYPSEAIATWRSLSLRNRRKKAAEIFALKKTPKNPKLIFLWTPLKTAAFSLARKLPEQISSKISEKQFSELCEKLGIIQGSFDFRILYAYLLVKDGQIDLTRLPKNNGERIKPPPTVEEPSNTKT